MLEFFLDSFFYGDKPILQNVRLCLKRGDHLWLRGRNGVGKTTILMCIAGILEFKGFVRTKLKPVYISAAPIFFSFLSLDENLFIFNMPEKPEELKGLLKKRVDELSFGERIFSEIFSFLSKDNILLLIDDCFSFLDDEKLSLIFQKITVLGREVLFVSQDVRCSQFAKRIITLENGSLVQSL
ncbi:MAG: ABC transporter ATP-binding protein [Deltaproteobacteria bacterium]|nr:ABC transporter ATP-binding protein [Deltaproteobacteria bacterium]MCX7952208.1 ABC transporter ATP-binding protein [Deltaproteobacteria bacterium]